MHDINNIPLVSSEVTGIWNAYMNDSMALCILRHFISTVEDSDVRPVLDYALKLSSGHLQELSGLFNKEGLPLPVGFSEESDLNLDAPRLFDDGFYMELLSYMARLGMERYSLILAHIARSDIRAYFKKCLNESAELYGRLADVRLSKGTFMRAPQVVVPKSVQFVEHKSFLNDWFGEKRPLLTREITQLFSSMVSSIVGRAILTGFGQVSKTKEVSEYMFRGRDITQKRISLWAAILTEENIPVPSISDAFVLDSTSAPFSEKLMMFYVHLQASAVISDAGIAMSNILRSDLHTTYARLDAEIMKYVSDGMDIMVKHRWFEQPPQAINHENLSEV